MNMNSIVPMKKKKGGGGYYGGIQYATKVSGRIYPKDKKKKGNSEMDRMSFVLDPRSRATEWSVV